MTYPEKNDILIPSTTKFDEIGNILFIVREVNKIDDELVAENLATGEKIVIKIDGILYSRHRDFEYLKDRLPKTKWYNHIASTFSSFRMMLIYSAILNAVGCLISYLDYIKIFNDSSTYGYGFCFIGTFLLISTLIIFKNFGNNFLIKDE